MDRKPRVLLVEDDPVSCSVFTLALEHGGAQVDACGSVRAARDAAVRAHHDLWLIDAHLPDGDGIDLLEALRARGLATRAVAQTASRDPGLHARLRAAGFVHVLVKPLPAAELVSALSLCGSTVPRFIALAGGCESMHWNDGMAMRALGGRQDSLRALRALFVQELPAAVERCRVAVHAHDDAMLCATLHRLQASCAFVGATALLECVRALRDAPGGATLAAFECEAHALLVTDPAETL